MLGMTAPLMAIAIPLLDTGWRLIDVTEVLAAAADICGGSVAYPSSIVEAGDDSTAGGFGFICSGGSVCGIFVAPEFQFRSRFH